MTAGKSARSTIAFQGAPGAFSHRAALLYAEQHLGDGDAQVVPCEAFAGIFEALADGRACFGVVPLENSTIGSIVANYDLLWEHDVCMVGEVVTTIHHQLLGLAGAEIKGLREVYSHPAALEQCRRFFAGCPWLKPVAFFDTSGAARHVAARKDATMAAIAGEFAMREYGLSLLQSNIEDSPHNRTRFGVIANAGAPDDALPEPPYKISAAVELPHSPGSLSRLLSSLAAQSVNLTKIESRPIADAPWHYRFFVDMELDDLRKDEHVVKALADCTERFKLIGRYMPWVETRASAS